MMQECGVVANHSSIIRWAIRFLRVLEQLNKGREVPITIRLVKYLNNIVEQDHYGIKRITRPKPRLQIVPRARAIFAGIELIHMVRQGQFMLESEDNVDHRPVLRVGRTTSSGVKSCWPNLAPFCHFAVIFFR